MVVMRRDVEDSANIVHIAFRDGASTTRDERFERDNQCAFLEVKEFRPDRLVDCFYTAF